MVKAILITAACAASIGVAGSALALITPVSGAFERPLPLAQTDAVTVLAQSIASVAAAAMQAANDAGLTGDDAAASIAEAIAGAIPADTPADVAAAAIDMAVQLLGASATPEMLQALRAVKAEVLDPASASTGGGTASTGSEDDAGPPSGGAGEDEGDDPGYVEPEA